MPEIMFNKIAEVGTTPWIDKMEDCGKKMSDNHVRQAIFVHGTFVGGDPLGIFGIMKSVGTKHGVKFFNATLYFRSTKTLDRLTRFILWKNFDFSQYTIEKCRK